MFAPFSLSGAVRGAPTGLRGGGVGSFFVLEFFLVALGLQEFFWPVMGTFLVVALLHDLFFALFCIEGLFLVTSHPLLPGDLMVRP